ncbi:hypothetical protein ACRALDRAFT_1060683 [Sodiomyces alcalophilus JCM 7366]|uniref:uncharacterized protein n=1 Tax=Sodiomyces alcalophilus JCM 7366 TaxID=591952 RepID=UPI0039B62839
MGNAGKDGKTGDIEMAGVGDDGGQTCGPGWDISSETAEGKAQAAAHDATLAQNAACGPPVLPALRSSRTPPKTRAQRFDAMFPRGTGESA